jgi:DNA (cytosine-5)-methyltransferase 1
MLSIGSVCSGVGGLELGLEQAGLGPVEWQIEKDEHCTRVLTERWPHAKRFGDVRDVAVDELSSVDLVCGGFPCQGISAANPRGRGLQDSRSGLWAEFYRLVGGLRPSWVVVENSGGNASRWVDPVCADLAQAGFAALPIPLEGRFVGAPHRRSRVFVVAYAHGDALRLYEQRLAARRQNRVRDEGHPEPVDHGTHAGWPSQLEVVPQVHGVSRRVRRALGNAVIPHKGQVLGHLIKRLHFGPDVR